MVTHCLTVSPRTVNPRKCPNAMLGRIRVVTINEVLRGDQCSFGTLQKTGGFSEMLRICTNGISWRTIYCEGWFSRSCKSQQSVRRSLGMWLPNDMTTKKKFTQWRENWRASDVVRLLVVHPLRSQQQRRVSWHREALWGPHVVHVYDYEELEMIVMD